MNLTDVRNFSSDNIAWSHLDRIGSGFVEILVTHYIQVGIIMNRWMKLPNLVNILKPNSRKKFLAEGS